MITGESLFLTHFTNQGKGRARLPLLRPIPVPWCQWTLPGWAAS